MSDPICEYYFIVPDADEAHVLLVHGDKAWMLPHTTFTGAYKWQLTAQVNKTANETFGFRATTRRCASPDMDPGSSVQEVVYVIENQSAASTLSSTARWVGAGDLAMLTIATPGMVRVLKEWFDSVNAADKSLRVPWYEAGWMNAAGAWMVQQLARLDSKPVGPVEQVCSWQRSCVMRLLTTHGAVYFKAVPVVLGSELDISVLLDNEYPGMVAEVMAVDTDRRWLLDAGHGYEDAGQRTEPRAVEGGSARLRSAPGGPSMSPTTS